MIYKYVEAIVLAAEVLEEGFHGVVLGGAPKDVREAAIGEAFPSCNLGVATHRATD